MEKVSSINAKLVVHLTGTERLMTEASVYLQKILEEELGKGKKIILLLSGGSAIEVYRDLTQWLKEKEPGFAGNLSVGLVDERYGPVGHADSNEEQIRQAGFLSMVKEKGGQILDCLTGQAPQIEADRYDAEISKTLAETDELWAVLGVGPDGHTAGILPQPNQDLFAETFPEDRLVVYYRLADDYSNPFKERITLTPKALEKIDLAVVVAKSQGKEEALKRLFSPGEPIFQTPAAILSRLQGALFTDKKIL